LTTVIFLLSLLTELEKLVPIGYESAVRIISVVTPWTGLNRIAAAVRFIT
jgi:hypothetical protein